MENSNLYLLFFCYIEMRGYRKLIEAQRSLQSGEFLVAKDIASGGIKRYYVFSSLEEFNMEQWNHRMHWYEVINGRQRLYIDIDIPHNAEDNMGTICDEFFDRFVSSIRTMIPDVQINSYISHIPNRHSYHIILLNCILNDQYECKKEVERIIDHYKEMYPNDRMIQFIDRTLYKRNQLFRILESSKIDKNNTKKIYNCDLLSKDVLKNLQYSLVSNYI